jgi:hypothetical protein
LAFAGPNSKIISYSLYGNNSLYFESLEKLIRRIYKAYPSWTIRIYHDSSITTNTICKYACLKDEQTNEYLDIVDFCNVTHIEHNFEKFSNFSYVHGMKWRFLPIGDIFVTHFMSRDTDSLIIDRELDSVNVWMNSNTLLHVMRGISQHLYALTYNTLVTLDFFL